jgi:hypothetical protein
MHYAVAYRPLFQDVLSSLEPGHLAQVCHRLRDVYIFIQHAGMYIYTSYMYIYVCIHICFLIVWKKLSLQVCNNRNKSLACT